VLKSVQIFVDFIKLPDRLDWQNAMKRAEKVKVFHVVSDNGFMDVRNVHSNVNFTAKAKDFVHKYSAHVRDAAAQSKVIHLKSIELANCINSLAKSFEEMGKMNKKVKIPTQHKLYAKLSKIFSGQSLALQNNGELIKIYCAQAMKYYKQEHEPMLEVLKFRDQ